MKTPFVKVNTQTRIVCRCPLCDKHEFSVGHLLHDAAKSDKGYYEVHWDCKSCNAKFDIRIFPDRHVEFSQTGVNDDPYIPSVVLLRSNTGTDVPPIYAVVRTGSFKKSIEAEQEEPGSSHLDYYYGEGTCPMNWMNDVVALIQDGDDDPHGCFEFVTVLDEESIVERLKAMPGVDAQRADDEDKFIADNVRLIFPQLFEGGNTFEGAPSREQFSIEDLLDAPVPTGIVALSGIPSEEYRAVIQGSLVSNHLPDGMVFKPGVSSTDARLGRGTITPPVFYGSVPDTIEDSYVFSEAFVKRVDDEGGGITANGIMPKESVTRAIGEADELSFGVFMTLPADMTGYWSRVFRQFEEHNLILELINRTSLTQETINHIHTGGIHGFTNTVIREVETVMAEYGIKAVPPKE